MAPTMYAWILPHRLAVAERPGGGGRSHRAARRERDQAWWWEQGVRTILSAKPTRHGLLDYALAGFAVGWCPFRDEVPPTATLAALAEEVERRLGDDDGAVMVHCDLPGEWLTVIDAALRLRLGLAASGDQAIADAGRDGLPVGSFTAGVISALQEVQRPDTVLSR